MVLSANCFTELLRYEVPTAAQCSSGVQRTHRASQGLYGWLCSGIESFARTLTLFRDTPRQKTSRGLVEVVLVGGALVDEGTRIVIR